MSNIIGNHVGGSRVSLSGGTLQDVFNPSTGEVSGQVRLSSPKELDDVVKVASEAAVSWAATPAAKRAQVMYRFKRLLEENSEKVANSISSEHGKTHDDALGEVARGLEAVEFSCGIPHLLKGTFSEQVAAAIDVYSIPQPLGVVAGITPFNFPAMVPMWMFPNALACGNAFILKPSERDPSVTLIIADLLKEAGLPEGVFSVVQGDKVVVDAILDNPEIKAVSFVGSTPVAEYIYTRGSGNGKRVQALGGAKNHMVIMPDADMDQVVDALMGEYGNPEIAKDRKYLASYSPYHQIKADIKYPEVLFTTSTKDDRVHPGHARKTAAKMMSMGHKVFFFENPEGGHAGASNPRDKAYQLALTNSRN